MALQKIRFEWLGAGDGEQHGGKHFFPHERDRSSPEFALLGVGHLLELHLGEGVTIGNFDPPFAIEYDQVFVRGRVELVLLLDLLRLARVAHVKIVLFVVIKGDINVIGQRFEEVQRLGRQLDARL